MRLIIISLFLATSLSAQKDFNWGVTTGHIDVEVFNIDTAATLKIRPLVTNKDTLIFSSIDTFNLVKLCYITKEEKFVTIYDPRLPSGTQRLAIEYAGWEKAYIKSIVAPTYLLYNLLDEKKNVMGQMQVEPFSPLVIILLPDRKLIYKE